MLGFFFSPLIANSFFNLVEFVGRFTTGSLARFVFVCDMSLEYSTYLM